MNKDMAQEVIDVLTSNIDTLWVIDCAILVFIMQAGFMCMETGLSRHKNSINVALKNAADFGVSVVIFWIFGFGLMFGTSYNGFFGTDSFFFKTKMGLPQISSSEFVFDEKIPKNTIKISKTFEVKKYANELLINSEKNNKTINATIFKKG